MMSKIAHYHRSKRFISQMTTVLRALQFSMNLGVTNVVAGFPIKQTPGAAINQGAAKQLLGNSDMIIPDNEAVQLFIHFYKLLFLGSNFAQKMLKLQIDKQEK